MDKKPYRYWNEESIIKELKNFIDKNNYFPPCTKMPNSIWAAIKKTKKGIDYYRKILGSALHHRPKGYWNDIENLKKEINQLTKNNLGLFPTLNQIEKNLGNGGKKAVLRNGGIFAISEIMGIPYRINDTNGIYKTSDNHYVLSGYEFLFDEFLYSRNIPHSVNGLIHHEYNYRYDFKINDVFVEIWGFERNRKQKRCIKYNKRRDKKEKIYKMYGLKLLSIECEIFKKPIKDIFEYFLSLCENFKWNKKEINSPDLKKYLNVCHTWNEDKIIYELQLVTNKLNKFPTSTELKSLNKGGLLDAINRHGGIVKFSNLLGYKKSPKKRKYWNKENVIMELEETLKKYKNKPSSTTLIKDGYSALVQQMCKYGGFTKLMEQLNKVGINNNL